MVNAAVPFPYQLEPKGHIRMIHAREDYNRIQDPEDKIAQDEPVFLLRAKDRTAPDAVMCWARMQELIGGDQKLADLAYAHAEKMREWQAANGCKTADL